VEHQNHSANSQVPWGLPQARSITIGAGSPPLEHEYRNVIEVKTESSSEPTVQSRHFHVPSLLDTSKIKTEVSMVMATKSGLYKNVKHVNLVAYPEMQKAKYALSHLKKTRSNDGLHLTFDNISRLCTNNMIVYYKINSDSHCPSMESLLSHWCFANTKYSKIIGQIFFIKACKGAGIIPDFVADKFRENNWSSDHINLNPVINQCLNNAVKKLEIKKDDLMRTIYSSWTDFTRASKIKVAAKLLLISRMAIWKIATHEVTFNKHCFKFNKLARAVDHTCKAPDTAFNCSYFSGKLNVTLNNKIEGCRENHYPWNISDYLKFKDLPVSKKQLGSILTVKIPDISDLVEPIIGVYPVTRDHRAVSIDIAKQDKVLDPPKLEGNKAEKFKAIESFLDDLGPNFAIPNLASKSETDIKQDLMLDRAQYALRWKAICDMNPKPKSKLKTPFESVIVCEPSAADKLTESKIDNIRDKIANINHAPDHKVLNNVKKWKEFNKYLIEEKLMIVSTDKTKKNKILKNTVYNAMGRKFLSENEGYTRRRKSLAQQISKTSNDILDSVQKHTNISKRDIDKLRSKNATPSHFYFLIKDHKERGEDGDWPIRPIASIHGTPVDGLDWLTQQIIQQALKYVPAHIVDGDQVLKAINEVNLVPVVPGWKRVHVSLDVCNLYPSIPTKLGVASVMRILKDIYQELDTYNIPITCIKMMLEHIFNNYEIQFDNKVYIQTKGAPMGARSSVALAIIVMHFIEMQAVEKLKKYLNMDIKYYGRYIDDTLLIYDIPIETDIHCKNTEILMAFNAIDHNIQFTMEEPSADVPWLPFLDTQLAIINNVTLAKWYQKPLHSGNMLDALSFTSWNSKSNFIKMCFTKVRERSNFLVGIEEGYNKLYDLLTKNGYSHNTILSNLIKSTIPYTKTANKFTDKIPVRIVFQSNRKNKVIKKEIDDSGLPIVFINDKINRLSKLGFKPKPKVSCGNDCKICKLTKDQLDCTKKNVVYELSCRHCHKNYIGTTNRTLKIRMVEHAADIAHNRHKYGPNAHIRDEHPDLVNKGLANFCIEILRKCNSNVNTKLAETRLIATKEPVINKIYIDNEMAAREKRKKKRPLT
jgi:hypothetical protein